MKKIWFSLLSFFGVPLRKTHISGNSIPDVIHDKFFKLYPHAYNINWYAHRGDFEARFTDNQKTSDTLFRLNGEVIKHFKATNIHLLPKHIIKKITKGLSGYSIVDVMVDEYHDDPKYKITFRKVYSLIEVECDAQGKFIRENLI